MAEEQLEFVEELTYLGMVFEQKLKWKKHLLSTVKKAKATDGCKTDSGKHMGIER